MKTFKEFMAEAVSKSDAAFARSGVLSRHADALQREIDAAKTGKRSSYASYEPKKPRKVRKQDFVVR